MILASNTPIIFATYIIVAGVLSGYSYWLVRRGRELAEQTPDAKKYWQ